MSDIFALLIPPLPPAPLLPPKLPLCPPPDRLFLRLNKSAFVVTNPIPNSDPGIKFMEYGVSMVSFSGIFNS